MSTATVPNPTAASAPPRTAVTWFEIPTTDLSRACMFYNTILETNLRKEESGDEAMCIFPSAPTGIRGALVQRQFMKPTVDGTVVYLCCDGQLEAVLSRVTRAGGVIIVPRTEIPGGLGFFACIRDSEGNQVGLHSAS